MDPVVTNIKRAAPDAFAATIDGVEWLNITPASRFYPAVEAAILAGEPVVDAQTLNGVFSVEL